MTVSTIALRRSSMAMESACWVETTTVSMRAGRPSGPYSTETWLLPSGRSQGSLPLSRAAVRALGEVVGVGDGGRHELLRLRAGEAEHHALVASAGLSRRHRRCQRPWRYPGTGGPRRPSRCSCGRRSPSPAGRSRSSQMAFLRQARDIDLRGRGDLAHDEDHAGRGRASHTRRGPWGPAPARRRARCRRPGRKACRDVPRVTDSEVKIFLLFIFRFLSGHKKSALPEGQNARNVLLPHLSIPSPDLAPCVCRLPGFIGPFPPPLLIRLFSCTSIIQKPPRMSSIFFRYRQISPVYPEEDPSILLPA